MTRAPTVAGGTVELKETASEPFLPTAARPCERPGYPEGLFEAKDAHGLPIFFDPDGRRLRRVWGPGTISDFQLANMNLRRTGL